MNKDKEFYVEPPSIPSRVYVAKRNDFWRKSACVLLALWFLYVAITKGGFFWLTSVISILLMREAFFSNKTKWADVTKDSVSAAFDIGQSQEDAPLQDYALLIKETNSTAGGLYSHSNYRYEVALFYTKGLSIHYKEGGTLQLYPYNKNHPNITLVNNIMCPVNLREWVESFQSQIAEPLPLMFASDELKTDYETGVYRSSKNRGQHG